MLLLVNIYLCVEQSFESLNSDHMKSCQFPMDEVELYEKLECRDCLCPNCQVCGNELLYYKK